MAQQAGYKREVTEQDWAKYGLSKDQAPPAGTSPAPTGAAPDAGYEEAAPPNDLYTEEQKAAATAKPWWKTNFFVSEPVLFGTWDGVFTSVMINTFGIIVFLRTGWMVGNAGVDQSVLVLFLCMMLALIPVLSAIGICERCQIQSGGVYFLISHILGGQIGGAVGVIYAFGQAAAASMVAIGFGYSMGTVFHTDNIWVIRSIAIAILLLLLVINILGVKWVIKLQLVLFVILVLAVFDFILGSFLNENLEKGVVGYSHANFRNNTASMYSHGENFFTVFGVFFSTFTGVLSGVNMSGDLKNPSKSIPVGELSALLLSAFLSLAFILILGAVCTRHALLTETMIAEQVSWVGFLFLSGVYISSLSSILGSIYSAPRVLQCIAAENVIPFIKRLEYGRGPNKTPVMGAVVVVIVAVVFIFIGGLNTLATISTMPYMITYAFISYAYISLAMTFDLQQQKQARDALPASYGSMDKIAAKLRQTNDEDLNRLFPERQGITGGEPGPDEVPVKPMYDAEGSKSRLLPETHVVIRGPHDAFVDSIAQRLDLHYDDSDSDVSLDEDLLRPHIISQPKSWYSFLLNRYIALVGVVVNIIIIFLVHWGFAIAHLLFLVVVYVYIGQANPGVFPGISEFSIPHSVRTIFGKWKGGDDKDSVLVTPYHPGVETLASRLNEDNRDYSGREQYHQSRTKPLDHDFD